MIGMKLLTLSARHCGDSWVESCLYQVNLALVLQFHVWFAFG